MTTKAENLHRLISRLEELGFTYDEAHTLRRIEMTLHRWAEQECGDGNDFASWAIERDEKTGKPYRVIYPHNGPSRRRPIPDKERGALRRLAAIMSRHPTLWAYQQTDPRGCALYIGRRQDIAPTDNPIVTKAEEMGLRVTLAQHSEPGKGAAVYACDAFPGRSFDTPEAAARAFLRERGLTIPDRNSLPLDRYYTRGIAVAA